MAAEPTFVELEDSARAAINSLKLCPEFLSSKIAIIGGAALWKHIPNGRTTEDVDFIITVSGAPQSVKSKLLQLPNSPFAEFAQLFVYKHPCGKDIQIDFTPEWQQSAFVPEAATVISNVNPAALPYISALDLLALKINTCGLRPTATKKTRDARDALALALRISQQGPVTLNQAQRAAILQGIEDVGALSGRDVNWWKSILNL
ncbi:hypothetical protein PRK78_007242 [Emydomyces testavorans]|uniref:Uncharacterized protein n=1 Tax=Emydomyces testavorans TaxID=2070801 RepID=A0AAF0DP07_9EURO|nr:hypothetical protein PRK78_007242 [Emydomyces testavorans]